MKFDNFHLQLDLSLNKNSFKKCCGHYKLCWFKHFKISYFLLIFQTEKVRLKPKQLHLMTLLFLQIFLDAAS